MIKLSNLVLDEIKLSIKEKSILVKGLSTDSRSIRKGYLFAVLTNNANLYIDEAIKKGAKVLLVNSDLYHTYSDLEDIVVLNHASPSELYGRFCARYYKLNFENIVAVTGTNGKTSVAWFVNNIWHKIGIKSASIGTLGVFDGKNIYKTDLTTPNIDLIYEQLAYLNKNNFKNVIIEASSHGIDQNRIGGLSISIAAITTLSRDHLDYHLSYKNYKMAKLKLFSKVSKNGLAIINDSIKEYKEFEEIALKNKLKILKVGQKYNSDLSYQIKVLKTGEQLVKVHYKNFKDSFSTNLIGGFQVNNLITSMAILLETGVPFNTLINSMKDISSPPGRMEYICNVNQARIFVDFAHTPDALKNVLLESRPHTNNKLCIVFGCGGDRDKGKRSMMGKIANEYADIIYITDDNPRNEDPKIIRNEIISKCPNAIEEPDRKKAIMLAISNLKKGDLLLVLGKGHEDTQEINNRLIYFNDKNEILDFVQESNYE